MLKKLSLITVFVLTILIAISLRSKSKTEVSGAPPYGEAKEDVPQSIDPYAWLREWQRPEGPPKVGLQIGHWKNEELPDELSRLRGSTGSSGGGYSEWEVNLMIAEETKSLLEEKGILVDLLPATIPPKYYADAFIAIHADGSDSYSASGYKVAPPWRDFTRKAKKLSDLIEQSYGQATKLDLDPNISRNMRGYYAFSWWRYEHALHPMTVPVILETGFLTNYSDRQLLINQSEIPAQGIAGGIIKFLENEGLFNIKN